jgi:hypothetical protein
MDYNNSPYNPSSNMMTLHIPNDIKVCENIELKIYQDVEFKKLSHTYNELQELIDLFSIGTNNNRSQQLEYHRKNIENLYLPKIKDAKRLLKNTEKRIEYNAKRGDLLRDK